MTVEWSLANEKDKEVFILGSGNWYRFLDYVNDKELDPVTVRLAVTSSAFRDTRSVETNRWLDDLSMRLYNFCKKCGGDTTLFSDADEYNPQYDDYTVVDSRYLSDRNRVPFKFGG